MTTMLHNHAVRQLRGTRALGPPAPSTSDRSARANDPYTIKIQAASIGRYQRPCALEAGIKTPDSRARGSDKRALVASVV